MYVYVDDEIADDTVREIAAQQSATGKHVQWSLAPEEFERLLWALQACHGGDNRPLHDDELDNNVRKWALATVTKFAKRFGEQNVTVFERDVVEYRAMADDYEYRHNAD